MREGGKTAWVLATTQHKKCNWPKGEIRGNRGGPSSGRDLSRLELQIAHGKDACEKIHEQVMERKESLSLGTTQDRVQGFKARIIDLKAFFDHGEKKTTTNVIRERDSTVGDNAKELGVGGMILGSQEKATYSRGGH